MKPVSYEITSTGYKFNYDPQEMDQWEKRGIEKGDAGHILMEKDGDRLIFHSFGTIDGPCTTKVQMTLIHNPLFDGPWDLNRLMNPRPPDWLDPENIRLVFIDSIH